MEVPPLRTSVVAALAAVALVAGLWWQARAPDATLPLIEPVIGVAAVDETITVHIAGAVRLPGLVELPRGARVADAIALAGGARQDADLSSLNLAAPVADGAHLIVAERGSSLDGPSQDHSGPVRVNSATAGDLERIPGVGPVLAERIVAHREANGPFVSVEDLLDVPGIGEGKLASMRDSVAIP